MKENVNSPSVTKKTTKEEPGVLLRDEIKRLVDEFNLIENFDENNLKDASYDLRLGDECRLGGKPVKLGEQPENRYLRIPPHEVAIVETYEKINMPKNLIGRWNLRIEFVYRGLLWVGGPQVDPDYKGRLYCPLYNLSTSEVALEYKKTFASIDFVRTTPLRVPVEFKPKRKDTISAYNHLQSAPRDLLERIKRLEHSMTRFQAIVFSLIALIFTSLAIIVSTPSLPPEGLGVQVSAPLLILIIAALAAFLAGFIVGKD